MKRLPSIFLRVLTATRPLSATVQKAARPLSVAMSRRATLLVMSLAVSAMLLSVWACDDLIYDDEGDCSTTRLVTLTYSMNMEWADAFANRVETVTLYAFGNDGVLAYQKTQSAADITAADGVMDVSDMASGTYTLVVWALGEETTAGSYVVPTATVGTTTLDELTRTVATDIETVSTAAARPASPTPTAVAADGAGQGASVQGLEVATRATETTRQVVANDLTPLLHGMATSVDMTDVSGGGTRTAAIDLTLDTNTLVVVLQHLSGAEVDVTRFTFEVSDANITLSYDNTPGGDITYYPWVTYSGTASTDEEAAGVMLPTMGAEQAGGVKDSESSGAQTRSSVGVAVAEFTLNRLMADGSTRLTVYNQDGDAVLSIPVVDYALMVRGYYSAAMTDQDYLDRQSDYSMTFFLDDSNDEVWIKTSIIINGWHLIIDDIDL